MRFLVVIFFMLFTSIKALESNILIIADTTINKGAKQDTNLVIGNTDSTAINDTLINKSDNKEKRFIHLVGLDENSLYHERINHKDFLTEDYRNLSDIFSYIPFGFLQDLGAFGQANEQMFYGLGFGNISYSRDGVLLNDRWQNSYNLNKLSVEPIDSIELSTITKGFLYNPYSNPISVSMNSRYKFPKRPVTYLKFYQASYDEGFVDVLFHSPITEKIDFGIDVSNSAIDSRFSNSDYESWKLNAQLNYNINENLNIRANYFFSYDTLALFGGLDTNKMLNDNFSPVLYPYDSYHRESSRYMLTYNNHATLKILGKLFPQTATEFTLYLNSVSQKFRQNSDSLFTSLPTINHDNNQFTWGANLRNNYKGSLFSLDIIANYESTSFNTDLLNDDGALGIFTLSGDIQLLKTFKYFKPSLFSKFSDFSGSALFGYGFSIEGNFTNKILYFISVSQFQQQVSHVEQYTDVAFENNLVSQYYHPLSPSDNSAFEVGVKFNYEKLNGKLSYFNYTASNKAIPFIIQYNDSLLINEASYFLEEKITNSGINFNFNLLIWRFLFSNNISYYFSTTEERVYSSPAFTVAGKVYYNDILFNNNLKLKTGFSYRFATEQNPFVYDFEKSLQINNGLTPLVNYEKTPSSLQLDLFLAGTIQERATIFITLENILNTEYYIVPYYFKQALTLRFGVSWILFD